MATKRKLEDEIRAVLSRAQKENFNKRQKIEQLKFLHSNITKDVDAMTRKPPNTGSIKAFLGSACGLKAKFEQFVSKEKSEEATEQSHSTQSTSNESSKEESSAEKTFDDKSSNEKGAANDNIKEESSSEEGSADGSPSAEGSADESSSEEGSDDESSADEMFIEENDHNESSSEDSLSMFSSPGDSSSEESSDDEKIYEEDMKLNEKGAKDSGSDEVGSESGESCSSENASDDTILDEDSCSKGSDDQTTISSKKEVSADLCTTCKQNKYKYKCPGCTAKSCSVECVKEHKKLTNCTGNSKPFKNVSVRSDLTAQLCLQDYRFLREGTDMITSAGNTTRTSLMQNTITVDSLQRPLKRKVQMARNLDQVKWKSMSGAFTRNKNNKTVFNMKKKQISWHVEWSFSCGKIKKHLFQACNPTTTLENLIKPFVDVKSAAYDYELEKYRLHLIKEKENLHFFLCNEEVKAGNNCFKELDGKKSVNKNLSGSTIIEYPRIHVVLQTDLQKYLSNNMQDISK